MNLKFKILNIRRFLKKLVKCESGPHGKGSVPSYKNVNATQTLPLLILTVCFTVESKLLSVLNFKYAELPI